MHNSQPMRTDEHDPKAPRPTVDGIRQVVPHEDPKQHPRPLRTAKTVTSSLEMVEQFERFPVREERDRHLHV